MTLTKRGETRPAHASWGLAAGDVPWEYAPAPEATDHVHIEPEYGLFIGNEFARAKPHKTFTVINPATEEPLAKVAACLEGGRDRAVAKAREGIGPRGRSCRAESARSTCTGLRASSGGAVASSPSSRP